jgi:hypothetical protein
MKTESHPSFSLDTLTLESLNKVEISSSIKLDEIQHHKNYTRSNSVNEKESNAIYGAYLALDSFLNATKYYKYSRNAFGCKDEVGQIVKNVLKEISILNDKTLISKPIEFMAKFTATMSEIFYHSRELLSDCKHVPEELRNVLDIISNYINHPDPKTGESYFLKFFTNLEANLFTIFSYFEQISNEWKTEKYTECGVTLGKLFNIMFEI